MHLMHIAIRTEPRLVERIWCCTKGQNMYWKIDKLESNPPYLISDHGQDGLLLYIYIFQFGDTVLASWSPSAKVCGACHRRGGRESFREGRRRGVSCCQRDSEWATYLFAPRDCSYLFPEIRDLHQQTTIIVRLPFLKLKPAEKNKVIFLFTSMGLLVRRKWPNSFFSALLFWQYFTNYVGQTFYYFSLIFSYFSWKLIFTFSAKRKYPFLSGSIFSIHFE